MSALPPCPLCGKAPEVQRDPFVMEKWDITCDHTSAAYEPGEGSWHRLWAFGSNRELAEAEWLRLAAPRPLPATVRAVLADAELFVVGMKMTGGQWRLAGSVETWIAAGRPGMEP